ncbi:MAG TPA: sulfotransferase domain-containing protein [Anaerolineales bacterium]
MSFRSYLRGAVYQVEKAAQRLRFASLPAPKDGWPTLLSISFPKSGTHLLDQILLGFSRVAPFSTRLHSFYAEYDGDTGRRRTEAETRAWLDSLRPLDITSAHLFAQPAVVARVATAAFVPYFIFRDPRDVAVSHVFYVTDMEPRHVHHAYYQSLPDFDARLRASILGRPDAGIEFPDIAGRFAPYLGWLDDECVLKVHFEELVNDRPAALKRILDHFLARVPLEAPRETILAHLESSINPKRSPTFRSGKTGEWKKHFTEEHKKTFKDVAGDLLVKLGYEKDNSW